MPYSRRFWGILLVLLCVSFALAGLLLVRRLVPLPIRESANAVTGIIYGAIYVRYGITLAFSLYMGNQETSEARETVERETKSLEGNIRDCRATPTIRARSDPGAYRVLCRRDGRGGVALDGTRREEPGKPARRPRPSSMSCKKSCEYCDHGARDVSPGRSDPKKRGLRAFPLIRRPIRRASPHHRSESHVTS